MKNKILIISHKADNDGIFSAAILKQYAVLDLGLKVGQIGVVLLDYNDRDYFDVRNLPGEYTHIWLSDFSFSRDDMRFLKMEFGDNFLWFDHHKPIIEACVDLNIKGKQSIDNCALYNVYTYLYPKYDVPDLFKILSAYDAWTWQRDGYNLNEVMAINKAVIAEFKLNVDKVFNWFNETQWGQKHTNWDTICDMEWYMERLSDVGNIILAEEQRSIARIIEISGDMSWMVGDRPACALFIQGPSSSQFFRTVPDHIKNGIVFKRNQDGTWSVNIYNVKDDSSFHCGQFCKNLGGGGHEGAAGFQCTQEEFINYLNTKHII